MCRQRLDLCLPKLPTHVSFPALPFFFAAAGEMGFDGVDYVSQFFSDKAEDYGFLDSLKAAATAAGVESVVILVHCNLSFIA
jgi:hypothetical protein